MISLLTAVKVILQFPNINGALSHSVTLLHIHLTVNQKAQTTQAKLQEKIFQNIFFICNNTVKTKSNTKYEQVKPVSTLCAVTDSFKAYPSSSVTLIN